MWPENVAAVNLFVALSTQWRMAPSGVLIGLDYAAVEPALRLTDVPRKRWRALFADLRVMEAAALDELKPKT